MYSLSIFSSLLLATFPITVAPANVVGNPTTPELCAEIAEVLYEAVAIAGLKPAIAKQVITNCIANT